MILCIGIGPGDPDYLTVKARQWIEEADVIAGFTTVVDYVRPLIPEDREIVTMGYKDQVDRLLHAASFHHDGKKVAVLFMGDIHFSGFQFLERVETACGHKVDTLPGITSAQILASRTRVCFDETTFITLHRRGDLQPFLKHLVHVLEDDRNAIVIPHPWDCMPKDIAAHLLENKIPGEHEVEVWENLTGKEAAWTGSLRDCTQDFTDMSIMLIRTLHPMPSQL